jgi:hypothetical protein
MLQTASESRVCDFPSVFLNTNTLHDQLLVNPHLTPLSTL